MQAKAMKILSGAGAAILASALVNAADDETSVEERIKPIGTVVVASPAPAPQTEGTSGMSGMAGMEGTSGMSGTAGMEGMSGMSGMAGMSGAGAGGGDGQALAQASGCLACHQLDAQLVGPGFKDVAAKYKGDAAARDMLIEKVKNGGAGNWGQVPMPPNAHVGVTEIAELVDWILAM